MVHSYNKNKTFNDGTRDKIKLTWNPITEDRESELTIANKFDTNFYPRTGGVSVGITQYYSVLVKCMFSPCICIRDENVSSETMEKSPLEVAYYAPKKFTPRATNEPLVLTQLYYRYFRTTNSASAVIAAHLLGTLWSPGHARQPTFLKTKILLIM